MRAAVRAGKTMNDPLYVQGDTLVVACYAALVGYSCTVTDIEGTRLYARGGLYDVGHESWPIPRLELYALVERGAREITDEDPFGGPQGQ
ncbi:hypothetical protein Pmar_PMAR019037 [Perkinsus marinus ATCC 50983]|uniref:Uncharacterized protein n=1 Tax=Perkinsus marinus (strain ATCC 50983 / TXsc) TaxID=423536 RepID=C5KTP3_PERM5|nr:hypothetical protein Pmar_PMAR022153 [Perkinsus marinus ATCC 50983]XP_002780140.1 hypothetical protein Pmar_PMAR019037 [Perkinsus marinus ATCC 50983]EER09716.1 hypothetical protein Pmar_PMAR022153 [Perkinsus marinus ATCC 50983]EER11935.1 hypothetical protein Pmar_PMAR019037 [Perkinsus marinus ATCC 50983]|eukprot:XP_002777921.1 hypothetical protein Pmar_PMAR022153 [Perkinsus marinus ATCC 50983]